MPLSSVQSAAAVLQAELKGFSCRRLSADERKALVTLLQDYIRLRGESELFCSTDWVAAKTALAQPDCFSDIKRYFVTANYHRLNQAASEMHAKIVALEQELQEPKASKEEFGEGFWFGAVVGGVLTTVTMGLSLGVTFGLGLASGAASSYAGHKIQEKTYSSLNSILVHLRILVAEMMKCCSIVIEARFQFHGISLPGPGFYRALEPALEILVEITTKGDLPLPNLIL